MSLQPGALREAIEQHIASSGFECVDLTLGSEAGRRVLRITVDLDADSLAEGDAQRGVPLDACARISRSLGSILEERDDLPDGYVLEVSSPGINRPLLTPAHYRRFRGERAKFKLREKLADSRTLIGVLGDLQEDVLEVQTPEGTHRLPLESIVTAQLHRDFDEILRRSKKDA